MSARKSYARLTKQQRKDLEMLARESFARSGGVARAKKLSKKRRTEIAKKAGLASAEKRRKQNNHENTVQWGTDKNVPVY